MPPYERTHQKLREMAEGIALSTSTVRRGESKGNNRFAVHDANRKIDNVTERVDRDIPQNDGIPPSMPEGVELTAFGRAISVTWNTPPASEYVDRTVLVLTNTANGGSTVQHSRDGLHVFQDLGLVEYRVRLAHIDRWGLQSDFTSDFVATPLPNNADRLADNLRINADRIEGVLGEDTLPEITDAAKLYTATRDALVQMGEQEQEIVHGNLIVGRTIVGEQLVSGTITADSGVLAEGSIGTAQIDNAAITSAKILNGSIGRAEIALAAINRARIEDAAVTNAKIRDLQVDKLTSGDITASDIRLLGQIRAGSVRLNNGGVQMAPQDGYGAPSSEQDRKVSTLDGDAAYGFHRNTSSTQPNTKGPYIRADGDSSFNGVVSIEATLSGNRNAGSTGTLNVWSNSNGPGFVVAEPDLAVHGDIRVGRNVEVGHRYLPNVTLSNGSIGAGGTAVVVHNLGQVPRLVFIQVAISSWWHPIQDTSNFTVRVDNEEVRVTNNTSTARTVRGWVGR